ncbi:MAG: MJ0042-type zinc finger domain-containing protein [Pirellulales bacterium]
MSFQAECPHCSIRFEAKSHLAGKTVRCPQCKEPFKIKPPAGYNSEEELIPVAKVASPKTKKTPTKKKPAPAQSSASEDDLLMQIKEPSFRQKKETPSHPSRGSKSSGKSLSEIMAEVQSESEKTSPKKSAPATVTPAAVNDSLPAIILPRKEHVSVKQPTPNIQKPSEPKPTKAPAKVEEKAETPKSKSSLIDLDTLAKTKESPDESSQAQDSAGNSTSNDDLDLKEKLRPTAARSGKDKGTSLSESTLLERDEEDLRLENGSLVLENWTSLVAHSDASSGQLSPKLEKEDSRVFPVSEVDWDAASESPSGLAELGDSNKELTIAPPKKSKPRPAAKKPPKKKAPASASSSSKQGLSSSGVSSSDLSGSISNSAGKMPTIGAPKNGASLAGVNPAMLQKIKADARKMTGGDPTLDEITAVGGTESIVQLSQALKQAPPPQPVIEEEARSIKSYLDSLSDLSPVVLYGAIGGGVLLVLIIGFLVSSGGASSTPPTDPNFQPTSARVTNTASEFLDPSGQFQSSFPAHLRRSSKSIENFKGIKSAVQK